MSTALLADQEETNILAQGEFQWYETTDQGMRWKPGTPQDVWLETMDRLCGAYEASETVHARLLFMMGDALAYGERAYNDEFAQAIDATRKRLKLSIKTIENASIICRNVPEENRHFVLTFSHYEAAQTLPIEKQAEILAIAEAEGDSVATLKNRVARARLTDEDRKLIATQTSQDPEELTAAEIKRAIKRAKRGDTEPPEQKAVIDLASDEGLLHAADKIAERLGALDFATVAVGTQEKWCKAVLAQAKAAAPMRRETFFLALANLVATYLDTEEDIAPSKAWDQERRDKWADDLLTINRAARRSATGGEYPATLIVHTPSGPVAACESHAAKIKALMAFMGTHTNATPAPEGAECPNCKNEAKSPNE